MSSVKTMCADSPAFKLVEQETVVVPWAIELASGGERQPGLQGRHGLAAQNRHNTVCKNLRAKYHIVIMGVFRPMVADAADRRYE